MTVSAKSDAILCSTAHLTAFFRSLEHERDDALFKDPYAFGLCGFSAAQKAEWSQSPPPAAPGCIIRTHITDRLLSDWISRTKADTVLNLGAGLDTRPYRLRLPAGISWVEVDLPEMIACKKDRMADQKPRVRQLQHVAIDIRDRPRRLELFDRVRRDAGRVLVLCEGLLVYLQEGEVASLANDLRALENLACWIAEMIVSKSMHNALLPIWDASSSLGGIMHFSPANGKTFFEEHGWDVAVEATFHDYYHRLKPHFQPWLTEPQGDGLNRDQNILFLAMRPSPLCEPAIRQSRGGPVVPD